MDVTPERPRKRFADFPTPTLESTNITEEEEEDPNTNQDLELSINFGNDTPLTPDELLFYALLKIIFPHNSFKAHSIPKQRSVIQQIIYLILGK